MKFLRAFVPGVALAASLFSGCFSPGIERADLDAAVTSAIERRAVPRTVEFLERLADRQVERERQLAQLAAAEREEFTDFTAENDPRFMWALEAECWARVIFNPDPAGPEALISPTARQLLEFEQSVLWAKLDMLRRDPAAERERAGCLLALGMTTGWSEDRLARFDFSSLPKPEPKVEEQSEPREDAEDPGKALVMLAAELLVLSAQAPPPREEIESHLTKLSAARIALAKRYLDKAEKRLREAPDDAAVAEWRIARARYRLERAVSGR